VSDGSGVCGMRQSGKRFCGQRLSVVLSAPRGRCGLAEVLGAVSEGEEAAARREGGVSPFGSRSGRSRRRHGHVGLLAVSDAMGDGGRAGVRRDDSLPAVWRNGPRGDVGSRARTGQESAGASASGGVLREGG